MKCTLRFRFSTVILSSVALLLGFVGPVGAVEDDAAPPAVQAPAGPAAAAPVRLGAVRAGISPEATTLTLEVSGEFTYFSSASGDRLIFLDLPGVLSTQPSDSHLLQSKLVSSYRVVPYLREGHSSARLEVLLKQPATITFQQNPGVLQVKFVAGGKTAAAERAPVPPAPRPAVTSQAEPPVSSPALSGRGRGNAIEKVTFAREEDGPRVQILANGPVEYRAFHLSNPPRLVLDIPQTESRAGFRDIAVGISPVKSIRVAQFSNTPPVSRVVMDLEAVGPYKVHPRSNGLEVEVRAPGTRIAPAKQPELQLQPKLAEARPAVTEPESPVAAAPTPSAALPEKAPGITVPASLEDPMVRMPPLAAPRPEVAPPTAPAGGQQATEPAAPTEQSAPAVPKPTPPPLAPMNVAAATVPAPAAPAPTPLAGAFPSAVIPHPQAAPAQQPATRYTGEPISVNLKDVDLKDFFRLIHEISGLNIVLDPAVSGRVTIVLEDVPWDQALDIVLRNNGLDKQLEGNVLRIARRDTLKNEETERLALEQARQAAAERVTVIKPLNYSRAAQMMATLSKFRSPKGEIIADERTNSLIITDIPQVIPVMDDLVRQLDRRSVQVEIEARVVAASRQFARELGAQFGFLTTATGGRTVFQGNPIGESGSPVQVTTNFPTRYKIEGDRLPLFSNFPAAGASSGFTLLHRSPNAAIDFIITAAENKGIGKLLSRPRIITQNNVSGSVQQGIQIPIQTTINNTISVQLTPVTLRLTVRPQVTNEGTIFLSITVTNNTIAAGIPRINGVPALSTQEATTEVLVNDGGTVVFGGVLQNESNLTIQQVPILGSIPVIGHLFKRTGVSTTTNELLFFITPKIV